MTLLTMSQKEVDQIQIFENMKEKHISQKTAAMVLHLSWRKSKNGGAAEESHAQAEKQAAFYTAHDVSCTPFAMPHIERQFGRGRNSILPEHIRLDRPVDRLLGPARCLLLVVAVLDAVTVSSELEIHAGRAATLDNYQEVCRHKCCR